MPTRIKVATWNLNSLRIRLPHLVDWLLENQPDWIGLQEIKMPDELFPEEIFTKLGYHCVWSGQKSYNGVAILSKQPIISYTKDLIDFEDEQKRIIAIETSHGHFINVYAPNGQNRESAAFIYKMQWYQHFQAHLKKKYSGKSKRTIICGDFNVAPGTDDIYDDALFRDSILCTPEERQALQGLLSVGFQDCFRVAQPEEIAYSWWDYRNLSFRRNKGARIDLILVDTQHSQELTNCTIDKKERGKKQPSDHAPVFAEFEPKFEL